MINRRNFLKNGVLLNAGGIVSSNLLASGGSNNATTNSTSANKLDKKLRGLQTYSLAEELSVDFPSGFAKIAAFGFTELEIYEHRTLYKDRKFGNYTVAEFRQMAEDNGLKITGSHISPNHVGVYTKENMPKYEEYWRQVIEEHAELATNILFKRVRLLTFRHILQMVSS
jgi:hypothetical protein